MKYEKDYYAILDVGAGAAPAEIRRAYRRLAILHHPDRNPDRQAHARMQEINEAYGVLSHSARRRRYDLTRRSSTTVGQTERPAYAGNAATVMDVEQIEIVQTPLGFPALLAIASFVALLIGALGWGLATQDVRLVVSVGFVSVLGSFSISGALKLFEFYKACESKARCPKCGNLWAAEKLGEKLVGVFQKRSFFFFSVQNSKYHDKEDNLVSYQRYKVRCRCKYCRYEWAFLESRK